MSKISRKNHKHRIPQIPEEIWMEILLKVPANLFYKLRGLSKFHRALVDSPEFSRRHPDVSSIEPSIILNRWYHSDHYRVDIGSANVCKFSLPVKHFLRYDLIGSCMGILCYHLKGICLMFWNPLTGFHRATKCNNPYSKYFLGHDSVTNDFKVLRISDTCVMIYSSKKDSWRKIDMEDWTQDIEMPYEDAAPGEAFVEGTNSTHFYVESWSGNIRGYDFAAEKFIEVPLPKGIDNTCYRTRLSCLGGCLCCYQNIDNPPHLGVWMMKEYGVQDSWIQLYSIHLTIPMSGLEPLAVGNNGRQLILWESVCAYWLYKYDTETKDIKLVEELKFGNRELRSCTSASPFTPSLQRT